MDFNPDCIETGCDREAVDQSGYCKKHKRMNTTGVQPQEWTLEYVRGIAGRHHDYRFVAEAHNAALAAEHDAGVFGRHLTELRAKYEKQLAAEREKVNQAIDILSMQDNPGKGRSLEELARRNRNAIDALAKVKE